MIALEVWRFIKAVGHIWLDNRDPLVYLNRGGEYKHLLHTYTLNGIEK